jgi:hypothetical protein
MARRNCDRSSRRDDDTPSPDDFPRTSQTAELRAAVETLASLADRDDLSDWCEDDRDADARLAEIRDAAYELVRSPRDRNRLSNDERLAALHSIAVIEHALGDDRE